jgi:SAM-dependent methyltransferase
MDTIPDELKSTSTATLAHYERNADDYAAGTREHDVSQNIATLLRHLEGPEPWTILDFGCGPGRDLKRIAAAGHIAIGLDGSEPFVRMAREATGAQVLHQNFLALDLPAETFDGIFANASLQHVPGQALSGVLSRLHAALKPSGVLFASIPRGDNEEGWNGARYSRYHDLEGWRRYLTSTGFVELEHYYRPTGLPYEEQRWLASAWRKA